MRICLVPLLLGICACGLDSESDGKRKDPAPVSDAKIVRARLEMQRLVADLEQHHALKGEWPEDWSFRRKATIDPWGEEYFLEYDGDRPLVSSMGADREPGTGDDVYLD
ncbi:MAG: hypothetical protein ACYTGV_07195 [Planctomycetota bacterium]|jgi:hypothetical protein